MDDPLVIAGKEFKSRLMVGTGRHRSMQEMVDSVEASGTEIITVAIRRLDLDNPNEKNILDYFDWGKYTILPNTAGCKTAEEAIFTAHGMTIGPIELGMHLRALPGQEETSV